MRLIEKYEIFPKIVDESDFNGKIHLVEAFQGPSL